MNLVRECLCFDVTSQRRHKDLARRWHGDISFDPFSQFVDPGAHVTMLAPDSSGLETRGPRRSDSRGKVVRIGL